MLSCRIERKRREKSRFSIDEILSPDFGKNAKEKGVCEPGDKGVKEERPVCDLSTGAQRKGGCRKRHRTSFTNKVQKQLEETFKRWQYQTPTERQELASRTGLTEKILKTWFQNRRMKERREQRDQAWKYFAVPLMPPCLMDEIYVPIVCCQCCQCCHSNNP
eukprot:Seg1363.5 transcript_id=Seg1363.5/GoldUCD/mRNA.D3Y31 product="Homeobox protein prophet of Pit-1" protein_id=Seg1363.5/GoldUCD/D3Y31